MAQVNIKPNRIKFIKALEDSAKRLIQIDKDYQAKVKQYEKDLTEWRKTADLSPDNIKSSEIQDVTHFKKIQQVVVVLKKYPANQPVRPAFPELEGYQLKEALQEINSIINMLKLTDEETVSASVANKVARYL